MKVADFDPDADWQQQRLDEIEAASNVRPLRAPAETREFAPVSQRDTDRSGPTFNGILSNAAFMARMKPPSYMLDGVCQRGMTYSLTGNTGHGKTAVILYLCLCVCLGEQFCGRDVRKGEVLFLAGENADNVRLQWFALCRDNGIDPHANDLPMHWHDGNFGISASVEPLFESAESLPFLELIVADTLQAFFQGDDDNSNPQMIQAARDFRLLTKLASRPTVIIPSHPVKNATKDNLIPRGGSAFTNEVDGNLTIWTADDIAAIHWQGKHRGPSFEPIKLELIATQPEGLVDEKGRQMPGKVARPLATLREEQITTAVLSTEDALLAHIAAQPAAGSRARADACRVTKTTVERHINTMIERKWVKRFGRSLHLTPAGKAVLKGDDQSGFEA